MSVYMSACMVVVYPYVCLPIYLHAYLSVYFVYHSGCLIYLLSVCLPICLLTVCMPAYPPVYQSVCISLSTSLSTSLSVSLSAVLADLCIYLTYLPATCCLSVRTSARLTLPACLPTMTTY